MNAEPWEIEGNELYFEAHGLMCYLWRNMNTLTWCGYVAFPKVLQARSKVLGASQVPDSAAHDFDVHGGVTFNGYIPQLNAWCLGFDTTHYMDRTPGIEKLLAESGRPRDSNHLGTYRDLAYVTNEAINLAKQMAEHLKDKEQ